MGGALFHLLKICSVAGCLATTACHLIFPFESSSSPGQDVLDAAPPDRGPHDQTPGDRPIIAAEASLDSLVTDGRPGPDAALLDTAWPDTAWPDSASPDAVSTPDGNVPAIPQFGSPMKLSVNSSDKDDGPHLSTDGLRIYFSSERSGGLGSKNIWWAARPSLGSPFKAPKLLQNVNKQGGLRGDVTLDKDELLILFEVQLKGKKEIHQATRTSRLIPFDPPSIVKSLQTQDDDEDPSISPDGKTIIFASNRPAGLVSNIWTAKRASPIAPFSKFALVAAVNSIDKDADPAFGWPHYVVFDSRRGGLTAPNLYIAARSGSSVAFGPPVPITSLNTSDLDGDPFLEPNTRRFLFERGPSGGDTDIFECTY